MNRPNLIRRIYAELRAFADPSESSSELLLAATQIAGAYLSSAEGRGSRATYYTGGIPFEFWSVDRAISDGGWRLLGTENELLRAHFGETSDVDVFDVTQWIRENAA